jgi:hypothetical protein
MPRVILPEQVILVRQSLNLGRKIVEPLPKFAPNLRMERAGRERHRRYSREGSGEQVGDERINSLGGFWKGQTFAFFIFLSSRFHEPTQFSSRLAVFLHLPVPIIIFDWIQQGSQFTTLFRTQLFDRGLDFFDPAHASSVTLNGIFDNSRVIRDRHQTSARQRVLLLLNFSFLLLTFHLASSSALKFERTKKAIIEAKIMNLSVEAKVAIAVATSFVVLIVGAMAQG